MMAPSPVSVNMFLKCPKYSGVPLMRISLRRSIRHTSVLNLCLFVRCDDFPGVGRLITAADW